MPPDERPPSAPPGPPEALTPTEAPGRYVPDLAGYIGEGAIGTVEAVRDTQLGRVVARKRMKRRSSGTSDTGPVAEERFYREARVTAQLEHPSIVPVYELGVGSDGMPYYTMKRVRGSTLAQAIEQAANLEERLLLLERFVPLCQAVAYAHSRGVVHRDLKPDNVMVGQFGETVVLDWGMARMAGQQDPNRKFTSNTIEDLGPADTLSGVIMGSPCWMSPEQARGWTARINARSDVWSLGAILYQILTGRPPHTGRTMMAVLEQAARGRVRPVAEACPAAPAELAAIAERATAVRQEDRYPSAAELGAEVERWRTGQRVHSFRYSIRRSIGRQLRRHRAAFLSLLAGFCAVSVVGAVSVARIVTERDRARAAESVATISAWLARARQAEMAGNLGDALALVRGALSLRGGQVGDPLVADLARLANDGALGRALPVRSARAWAMSEDGTRAALLDGIDRVSLWDADTGEKVCTASGGGNLLREIRFADQGRALLALASVPGEPTLAAMAWSAATCATTWTSEAVPGGARRWAVVPPGDKVVFHSEAGLFLATAGAWQQLSGVAQKVVDPVVSEDGRWLAAGSQADGRAWIWRLGDVPELAGELEVPGLVRLAFEAEGDHLLAADGDGRVYAAHPSGGWEGSEVARLAEWPVALVARAGKVAAQAGSGKFALWSLTPGSPPLLTLQRSPRRGMARGLAFGPAARRLAVTDAVSGELDVWTVEGALARQRVRGGLATPQAHLALAGDLSRGLFAPDGEWAWLWRLPADVPGRWSWRFPAAERVERMAVSADGARLVAASRGGRLRLIDSSSGAVVRASGPVGAADRPLATLGSFGDGFVAVWAPAEAGQSPGVVVRATFDGAGEAPEGEQAMGAAVAVAATRTGLVSIDAQGCVHGDGGAVLCLQGEAPMVDVTASEDGRFVVAMTRERARLLEMAPQPRELARPRLARGLQRARFRAGSADVAFLDEEGRILVVDATSTTEKLDVELGLPQASQLAWLPGGGFAVGTRDGAVRVVGPDGAWRWDALASRSAVTALEPSPDGAFLAVAAALGGLSVLDLATGARLNSFPDLWESMVALAWTPDGGRLIAADNLGSLHSLAIESPDPRATWTRTGAGSNLRVCRESGEVRPVVPFPDAESAWAPAAACAPTTGSALARNPGVDPGILERWRAVGD